MPFRALLYHCREALRGIARNGFMSLASVTTVAISLLVLTLFLLLGANLANVFTWVEEQVQIRAFLADDLTEARRELLMREIGRQEGVRSVTFIHKDQALQELADRLGTDAEILQGVDSINPLPHTLAIEVEPEHAERVAEMVAGMEGVDQVSEKGEMVRRLVAVTRVLRWGGVALMALLAVATVLVISNTIRLTVYARRQEIAIMKLVGATDSFIRAPFFIEGMLLGLAGSLLSVGGAWWAYGYAMTLAADSVPFLPMLPRDQLFADLLPALVAGGALLGVLGTNLSIKRFLRV